MDILLQWLLLSVAVAIGWCLGYFARSKGSQAQRKPNHSELEDKFKILFESYNDRSIESFVQSLEVNADTIAMHLSIGAHFRSKGEVDKAILIHQNLMSRPDLPDHYNDEVTFELAKDYVAIGLLDRGEGLLSQLENSKAFGQKSKHVLIDIFQREKDWDRALAKALELDGRKQKDVAAMISHLCCEVADKERIGGNLLNAQRLLKDALSYDKRNVRAYMAVAELLFENNEHSQAILTLRKAIEQDADFISVIVPKLAEFSVNTGTESRFQEYLAGLIERYPNVSVICSLADIIARSEGRDEALSFLWLWIEKTPSLYLLAAWLLYKYEDVAATEKVYYRYILQTCEHYLDNLPAYRCRKCGFAGSQLHWQCPGCKTWGRTKPVKGSAAS